MTDTIYEKPIWEDGESMVIDIDTGKALVIGSRKFCLEWIMFNGLRNSTEVLD